jgi:hypothetical protein
VTTTNHELNAAAGTFNFQYETYSIPDQIDVYYEGVIVFTTGVPVGENKTVQITYGPGTDTTVRVVVTGPSGTLWNYTVFCPTAT